MENWAEIRRLHRAEGMPIKAIARRLGISKNTVKSALACEEPPKYKRPPKGTAVHAFDMRIRELLAESPDMPVTVIDELVYLARSISVFCARVAELRSIYAPRDPASRTSYAPRSWRGAICDFRRWGSVRSDGCRGAHPCWDLGTSRDGYHHPPVRGWDPLVEGQGRTANSSVDAATAWQASLSKLASTLAESDTPVLALAPIPDLDDGHVPSSGVTPGLSPEV